MNFTAEEIADAITDFTNYAEFCQIVYFVKK